MALNATTNDIIVDLSTPYKSKSLYLVKTTRGLITASIQLFFEVHIPCSLVNLTLPTDSSLSYIFGIHSGVHQTIDVKTLFASDNINCPLAAFSLENNDGTPYSGTDVEIDANT